MAGAAVGAAVGAAAAGAPVGAAVGAGAAAGPAPPTPPAAAVLAAAAPIPRFRRLLPGEDLVGDVKTYNLAVRRGLWIAASGCRVRRAEFGVRG
jgi:hypothetical protein